MTNPFIIQGSETIKKRHRFRFFNRRHLNKTGQHGEDISDYFWNKNPRSLKRPIEKSRIKLLYISIGIVFSIIFIQLFKMQILEGRHYRAMAEGNRIRIQSIKAARGIIYDRNKIPLVKNVPRFFLAITPGDLPKSAQERNQVIEDLSSLINLNEEFLEKIKKTSKYSYIPIFYDEALNYQQAIKLKLQLYNLPGINVVAVPSREYISGKYFSHIIGYVGKISSQELKQYSNYSIGDSIGKTGLELSYEKSLRGHDGQERIEVNFLGKKDKIIERKSPQAGQDLILTIDSDLQKEIYEVLSKYVSKTKNKAGTAIALDPRNGEILSMVSLPGYNNNLFINGSTEDKLKILQDQNHPLINRAISGQYPSGSTIKPALALGALEEGIIDKNTTIYSTGGIKVGRWFYPDWKKGGHGPTKLIKALAFSVNTFFYYIGGGYGDFKGLGLNKIQHYLALFGFGQKSGIDISGESDGFVPTKDWKKKVQGRDWSIGDTYHLSIGQGDLLVTPLQIADMTSLFANRGKLIKPHLVKEIISSEEKAQIEIEPKIVRDNFITPEYVNLVGEGLRSAVTQGSARYLSQLEVQVAGKTGTAQVQGKSPHAWFTCFAPYDNPKFVLTILIENGGEGSATAVRAAKEILEWEFNRENKTNFY